MADKNLGHNENKNLVDLDEWVQQYLGGASGDISELKEKVNKMWSTIYPVGSIYLTVTSTNPSEFWGGTWVLWGQGRVPVGFNPGDNDFMTPEQVGGEKKHTLTIAEMPSHRHGITTHTQTTSNKSAYVKGAIDSGEAYTSTGYTGGNTAHNIMQPYIVCYMWKRTA